jgi:hypothetical protein
LQKTFDQNPQAGFFHTPFHTAIKIPLYINAFSIHVYGFESSCPCQTEKPGIAWLFFMLYMLFRVYCIKK